MSSKVESADRPSSTNNTVNTAPAAKAASQPASKKTVAKKPAASAPAVKSASAKPVAKAAVKPAAQPAAKKPVPVAAKATSVKATPVKTAALKPVAEKPKTEKVKMERDSFTMPKEEYAQIATLKKRMESLGKPVKKSELLRAGLKLLAAMNDVALQASLAAVPVIKTGRPKKKH